MEKRGYSVMQLGRTYQSERELSIVAFLLSEKRQKLVDVYIYHVDPQYLGIQTVSKQRINELRLQKSDLKKNFLDALDRKGAVMFPNVTNMSQLSKEAIFGLTYLEKKKLFIQEVEKLCPVYRYKPDEDVVSEMQGSFVLDLIKQDCVLKSTKITVLEINSAYLQYLYVIFDNEYFKSAYMLSPQSDIFINSLRRILRETVEEGRQIQLLKTAV